MFEAGVRASLEKMAAMDQTVHKVIKAMLPADASPADELEDLLPEDGRLEGVVAEVEDNFDVTLPPGVVFDLFAKGTVSDLERALVKHLAMKKTADHRYYMQHRAQIQQRNRQYRMRNLNQIRRRAKIYRAKVRRRQIRPRRRVGTRGGGYSFVPR